MYSIGRLREMVSVFGIMVWSVFLKYIKIIFLFLILIYQKNIKNIKKLF
jgi:hypothetical protein